MFILSVLVRKMEFKAMKRCKTSILIKHMENMASSLHDVRIVTFIIYFPWCSTTLCSPLSRKRERGEQSRAEGEGEIEANNIVCHNQLTTTTAAPNTGAKNSHE
jgi:hypothetical protein